MDDWTIARCDELIVAELHDELLGLHEDGGDVYGFNATAAWVWKAIDKPTKLSELCSGLVRHFEIEVEACDPELRRVLTELRAEGLVTITG
jgi:hypothetical protein